VTAANDCIIESAPVTDQDYVMLAVEDRGMGMDEPTRTKIFEPFFTTKEPGKGTGLGLAVVYGIVQQHNGCITVQSEVGRGTVVSVYLPLVRSEAVLPAAAPASEELRGGRETVLVGEDEPVVRELLRSELSGSGYRVIAAVDGEDAVAKFLENREQIELLLLDVMMPRQSGKDAYEAIRKVRPGVKILFMSGYTSNIIGSGDTASGGIEVLNKPFSTNRLLRKVREVLDRKNGDHGP
jgi:CheY-like chemotaxis protein